MQSIRISVLALAAMLACHAQAQSPAPAGNDPLRSAAQKAIAANPEVSARLNAVRAASAAIDISRGGLLPKVDLEASAGRTEDRITTRTPEGQSLSRSGAALSVTQVDVAYGGAAGRYLVVNDTAAAFDPATDMLIHLEMAAGSTGNLSAGNVFLF